MEKEKVKKTKKKNGFIKKALIVATIVAGVVATTYGTVPQVKEKVDEVVESIKDIATGNWNFNAEQIQKVENLKYDETNNLLSFDAVENARSYDVTVINLKTGEEFYDRYETNQINLPVNDSFRTGDTMEIKVYAVGKMGTIRSEPVSIQHEVKLKDERLYETASAVFLRTVQSYSAHGRISINKATIISMSLENGVFTFEGVGVTSGTGSKAHFTSKADFSKYLDKFPESFEDPMSLIDFYYILEESQRKDGDTIITTLSEFADHYRDLSYVLEKEGIFDEYLSQGYTLEVLKYEQNNFDNFGDSTSFDFVATYKAVHPTKQTLTFKTSQKISLESSPEFNNIEDVLNALEDGYDCQVEENFTTVLDYVLNNHLEKMMEARERIKQRESGQEFGN